MAGSTIAVEDVPEVTPEVLLAFGVAPIVVEAVVLLTHDATTLDEYQNYIERLAGHEGRAGALARSVKVADLRANLDAPERIRRAGRPRVATMLAKRYARALETLESGR